MSDERAPGRRASTIAFALLAFLVAARCTKDGPSPSPPRTNLRLGVSNAPALATERGIKQFVLNQTSEGLLRVNQEGHIEPWLAENWSRADDGLAITIRLRGGVKFHDGSPVDSEAIVSILRAQLETGLKSSADDVESIVAKGDRDVEIRFRRASALFPDALMDVQIIKPGTAAIATGAFMAAGDIQSTDAPQVVAFDQYYLGKPQLAGLRISSYPNVRAAWADMLRDQLDMLYEVGNDAIDAMQSSTKVSLYTFDRPYQYTIFLNTKNPKLKSREVRQALNQAIDRDAFVRDAMDGNGTPSVGPVSPHHWAFDGKRTTYSYAPERAVANLSTPLALKCITLADPPFEQLALIVKQQLRQVGVDLQIEQAGLEQIFAKLGTPEFESVLLDPSSGWSLMRPYRWWHSTGASNQTKFSSPAVDAALDRIKHAKNDADYKRAVSTFQDAMADDPPAIFLAWSKRSRAVSSRFDVKPEPGRDVLATLRLWHARADTRNTTH